MGKIRRGRQKLHAKAAKLKKTEDKADNVEDIDIEGTSNKNLPLASLGAENLFSGINIDLGKVTSTLPDDLDARSTITSKTFKGMNIKKKDKRKLRHELWMKKMDAIQTAKKEAKEKKKRQKTVIVGDMKPLDDSLPTLELLLKTNSKSDARQTGPSKVKHTKSKKQQQKDMLADISLFKQVYNHPQFQSDPAGIIQEHLTNKIQREEMEMDT